MITTEGEEWSSARKIVAPLFKHQYMDRVFQIVDEHARRLVNLWNDEIKEGCNETHRHHHHHRHDGDTDTTSSNTDYEIPCHADVVVDNFFSRLGTGVIAYLAFSSDIGALKSKTPTHLSDAFSNDFFDAIVDMVKIPTFLQNWPTP